jgi:hypothetical protein
MENQKVHEYTVETGSNGLPVARLGRVHNLITIGHDGEQFIYLDGRWVNGGGRPVDPEVIPPEVKAKAEAVPFKPQAGQNEQILLNCEFCTEILPSGEYAKHLAAKHIRPTAPVTPAPAAPAETVPGLDG